MGYDLERFENEIDKELICAICSGVLEDPLQAPKCEHVFCSGCLREWIKRKSTCPIDRREVTANHCKPVPRIIRNLLSKLRIECDNASHGCEAVLELGSLASHFAKCEYNPKKPTPCQAGCGAVIPKDELTRHNCVGDMRRQLAAYKKQLNNFARNFAKQKETIAQHSKMISRLKTESVHHMNMLFYLLMFLIVLLAFHVTYARPG